MDIHYNESSMKENRESFLSTGIYAEGEVREIVAQSWKRCREQQLNHKLSTIGKPSPSKEDPLLKKYIDYFKEDTFPAYSPFYEVLDLCKGVLFYADGNKVIYSHHGNKEQLQYFTSLNITIGSCISEEFLGTTGAAFFKEPNQTECIIGEEHYLDILTPFVTYGLYTQISKLKGYTLIIIPKEHFTGVFLTQLKLFIKLFQTVIDNFRGNMAAVMKNEYYQDQIPASQRATLFLDFAGIIVDANEIFCDWLKVKLRDIINEDCSKLFPEFNKFHTCLKTGSRIAPEEIFIQRTSFSNHCRMDFTPMINEQKVYGVIITLTARRTISQVSNSQSCFTFDNISGNSKAINDVKIRAKNAAHSNSSVLITGESGTGKELFAQAIHTDSARSMGPFVALNCACMPQELITSELFGYVEGAFTGARKGGLMGKFEYADQGTIFLDEIGELPMYTQVHLLRVLEEKRVTRIGSNTSIPVDFRLICATNRDLKKMVSEGTFRLDLYYRINVIHLNLPSLRERFTDIPYLVHDFINYFNNSSGKKVKEISPEALSCLVSYPWPGNIRELRNVIECSMNNVTSPVIELENLPIDILNYAECKELEKPQHRNIQKDDLSIEEKKRIFSALIENNGKKSHVADQLGMSRTTLYKKLKDYNLI